MKGIHPYLKGLGLEKMLVGSNSPYKHGIALNQDSFFFFHFNMQKCIQDLHNILHTLNHTMHGIFPCEPKLRQYELSFSFLLFFMFLKCPSWKISV